MSYDSKANLSKSKSQIAIMAPGVLCFVMIKTDATTDPPSSAGSLSAGIAAINISQNNLKQFKIQ